MATTAYSTDQYKNIVSRISQEIIMEGNFDLIEEFFAADFVQHGPLPEDVHGIEAVTEVFQMLRGAFPDLDVIENALIGDGDYVLLHHTMSGTHEGTFMDIESTDEEVAFDAMALHRFEDGKVAEVWLLADTMGLMQQLGVVEPFAL